MDMRLCRVYEVYERFMSLPEWMRKLIEEDMKTAFENRIKIMERINDKKRNS